MLCFYTSFVFLNLKHVIFIIILYIFDILLNTNNIRKNAHLQTIGNGSQRDKFLLKANERNLS